MLCSHASNFAILSGSISSVIYQPPIRHDHRSKSLVKERSKVQEKTRTGEEVGASVVVSEHGEHILDAAARRRVRRLTLLGSVPARPEPRKMDAGCCGIQIPEPRVSLTNERLSLPGRLVWGNGSEELGDGADGRPDHRRRVRRNSNDAARETPVAAPRSLQRDARAGDGLEDAAGAPQVAARRPGRGQPGSWAWRHQPPTAACSGEQTEPQELSAPGRQGLA